MTKVFNHNTVQSALGYYFKTPELLSAAFTHVSFSDTDNNETLTFLGERLIDFIISDYIFTRYPFSTEKQLKARLDGFKKALDYQGFISERKLSGHIRLSPSSEGLRESKAFHGEIFLAVCAAIYRDGGLPSFKAFVLPLVRAVDTENHYAPINESASDTDKTAKSAAKDSGTADKPYVSDMKSLEGSKAKQSAVKDGIKTDRLKKEAEAQKRGEEKNAPEKPEPQKEKKGVNIFKAIIMPSKGRKKETEPVTNTAVAEDAEIPSEPKAEVKEVRRSFIRDALTPVSLPESMRNPKPRKPYKYAEDATSSAATEAKPDGNGSDDTENYKSLLQEYVQKNIRSANVLIKYTTERVGASFKSEITLDGKVLAKGEGDLKKTAEKEAARIAYEQLTDSKSSLSSWFTSLSTLTPERAPISYISRLNEYYQKKARTSAAPLTYEPRPSDERKTFSVAIIFNGEELSVGKGHTAKDAKQDAAKKACEKLNIK